MSEIPNRPTYAREVRDADYNLTVRESYSQNLTLLRVCVGVMYPFVRGWYLHRRTDWQARCTFSTPWADPLDTPIAYRLADFRHARRMGIERKPLFNLPASRLP